MSLSKDYLLALKVSEKYIDVKLNQQDTKLSIYQKITRVYPNHNKDFDDLMCKIKRQLEAVALHVGNQQTKQFLKLLISKVYKQEKPCVTQQWTVSQITVNSRVRSCISDIITLPQKISYQKSIQTEPTEQKRQNTKQFKNQSLSLKKNSSQGRAKIKKTALGDKNQHKSITKSVNCKLMNMNFEKNQKNQKQNRRKCNPDMVKACETIMKKSNNNGMRTMAKQFLKQKGYLNQEVITHQRDKRKTYMLTQAPKNHDCTKIQSNSIETQKTNMNFQSQLHRNTSLLLKNEKERDISASGIKVRSKYSYNIYPKTEAIVFPLNVNYEIQEKQKQALPSKPQKKYNYLQI